MKIKLSYKKEILFDLTSARSFKTARILAATNSISDLSDSYISDEQRPWFECALERAVLSIERYISHITDSDRVITDRDNDEVINYFINIEDSLQGRAIAHCIEDALISIVCEAWYNEIGLPRTYKDIQAIEALKSASFNPSQAKRIRRKYILF